MPITDVSATPSAALAAAMNTSFGALAGAIDDLHRAALILRQESRAPKQRFRKPQDLRRIADQFSERARSCQTAQNAMLEALGQAPAASPS